jgi:hypothetical protein
VLADINSLGEEFQDVRINLSERLIVVMTNEISLEGIYLGRYEIELEIDKLPSSTRPYLIRSVDGASASTSDEVIHPHVRDGDLCEGDAAGAIRAALLEGRLLDFFMVVAQTLATYNPSSAYVELDNWNGVACADCGDSTSEDDSICCERCANTICTDCYSSCGGCERSVCGECSSSCQACLESHCTACLSAWAACELQHCEGCLQDDQCQQCRESAAEEEAEADQAPSPAPDDSVHTLCLGETASPA